MSLRGPTVQTTRQKQLNLPELTLQHQPDHFDGLRDRVAISARQAAFFSRTLAEDADQIGERITRLSAVPSPIPEMVNGQFCSDLRKSRDCKSDSPQRGSEEPQSELYEGEGGI